jgi:hypothetical protein
VNEILINGQSISVHGRAVLINGELAPSLPDNVDRGNIAVIDGNVFIDGYEYLPEDKKWKRTIRALWHKWF